MPPDDSLPSADSPAIDVTIGHSSLSSHKGAPSSVVQSIWCQAVKCKQCCDCMAAFAVRTFDKRLVSFTHLMSW
jgi:hypothetical protein